MEDKKGVLRELPVNILHILDHSLPYVTGYSLRSHTMIKLQRDLGFNPLIITSSRHALVSNPVELIDGIYHYRTFFPEEGENFGKHCLLGKEKLLISLLNRAVSKIAAQQRVDLIHAHSPCTNGLAALEVCRRKRIPLLYEIDDVQDTLTAGRKEETPLSSPVLRRNLEAFLWQQAGAVVVREERQREEIIRSGIPGENVYVVPREDGCTRETNLQEDNQTAGFICSLYHLQGVSSLLGVFLKERNSTGGSLAVPGTEGDRRKKKSGVKSQGSDTSGHIIYIGQVKPRNSRRLHPLINVLVYPWLAAGPIGEKVLSSDPIDALLIDGGAAAGEAADLWEMKADKQAQSTLGAEDISELTGRCLKLLINRQIRHICEERCRQQAGKNPSRLEVMEQYLKIYKTLLSL
ncbi:MAG: glycosyltransferase [bacterium]